MKSYYPDLCQGNPKDKILVRGEISYDPRVHLKG